MKLQQLTEAHGVGSWSGAGTMNRNANKEVQGEKVGGVLG